MTESMFRYLSKDGAKLAPSICPVTRATQDKAEFKVLFSVTPMKTASQTTHGSETRTATQPLNADVTYSDGSAATVQGQQTTTVVVPTETTISRSSVAVYMYAYRIKGDQLDLISTDDVVFSRVAASGSGDNAAGAELGAGIGNLIRKSKDRHRTDQLCEEALQAIRAEVQ
jgi:DNA-directed RNA polymerase subunit H (RpoH/RPB5)